MGARLAAWCSSEAPRLPAQEHGGLLQSSRRSSIWDWVPRGQAEGATWR